MIVPLARANASPRRTELVTTVPASCGVRTRDTMPFCRSIRTSAVVRGAMVSDMSLSWSERQAYATSLRPVTSPGDKTSDYDFDLPAAQIAQRPLERRDAARLMVVDRAAGAISHRTFSDITEL